MTKSFQNLRFLCVCVFRFFLSFLFLSFFLFRSKLLSGLSWTLPLCTFSSVSLYHLGRVIQTLSIFLFLGMGKGVFGIGRLLNRGSWQREHLESASAFIVLGSLCSEFFSLQQVSEGWSHFFSPSWWACVLGVLWHLFWIRGSLWQIKLVALRGRPTI